MKLSTLGVPMFLSGLLFVGIWGFGQLTVQASQTATQASLDMLRQQLEIQRLQQQLAGQTRNQLRQQLEGLPTLRGLPTLEGLPTSEPRPAAAPDPESTSPLAPELSPDPGPKPQSTRPKPWPTS